MLQIRLIGNGASSKLGIKFNNDVKGLTLR